MTGGARWLLGLALPPLLLLREAPPPARPAPRPQARVEQVTDLIVMEPPLTGGSPEPPAALPPARTCKEATPHFNSDDSLPGQVNGKLVHGAEGLRRLRRAWGDALIVVRNGDFAGADLRGARLHNICFTGTNFAGSDWRGALAPGIGFLGADLTGARLQGARMPHIRILGPNLERADASGADFSDGFLSGNALGSWEDLRLDHADLRRFRFDCGNNQGDRCVAYVRPASFRGADLRGAQVDRFWGDADLAGALLAGTQISLVQLTALAKARVEGPLIIREFGAKVRLSSREASWLMRHVSRSDFSSGLEASKRPPAGRWTARGRSAVFAALPLRFDREARSSPLYRRLMPAIVSGASSWVHVRAGRNGTVRVEGDALGANDHWCSVSGPPLRLDRATGWYVGPSSGPLENNGSWGGPLAPMLRLWGDKAELYRDGQPQEYNAYFQCGARAFFYQMTRIPVPASAAKRLWYAKGRGLGG